MTSLLEDYDTDTCPACCAILSHGDGSATIVQHRVADLLSQNIPPSDGEAHDLQHTDLDPAPYIARIQQRIDELTDEMTRLTIARAHLESHPHHIKGILHPMRSLPEDVLREIFLWSTGGDDEERYNESQDSLYPRRPQWVLSQVCRRWRDISHAFPRLWSSLYLNLGHSYTDPSPMSPSILRLTSYLDHSADQRMTVHIGDYEHWGFSYFVHLGPFLRQSASRWVDCKLYMPLEFVDAFLSNCDFGNLGRLRLELHPEGAEIDLEKLVAFKNTPSLRSLDYKNESHKHCRVLLPWEQLTTVDLQADVLDDVFTRSPLMTLTSVQRLTLQLSYLDLERDTLLFLAENPLKLRHLTSLCLTGLAEEDKREIGQVVSHLDMPAITELDLAFGADYSEILTITFPPFHSSVNFDRLTALSISFTLEDNPNGVVQLDIGTLVAFLRLVPNLQKFRLSSFEISAAVFDALALENGQSNVLPYLQILDFTGCDLAGGVSITSVLSMLESRCLLPERETNRRSILTQLSFSPSTVRYITRLCVNDAIRGRWDKICRSILSR